MQVKNNYNIPWEKDDGTLGEGVYNGDVIILLEVDRAGPPSGMTTRWRLMTWKALGIWSLPTR